jgi:hypothetical protein
MVSCVLAEGDDRGTVPGAIDLDVSIALQLLERVPDLLDFHTSEVGEGVDQFISLFGHVRSPVRCG